jgi:hypothetical protein
MFFALLFDDRPIPEPLFLMSVCFPPLVIAISWLMLRFRKSLAVVALGLATAAAYTLLSRLHEVDARIEARRLLEQKFSRGIAIAPIEPQYVFAVWFAAVIPFLLIAMFYFFAKNRPNKAPEPTPTSVTDRAAHAPRQP